MRIVHEKRGSADEQATRAVAALHRILVDERLLHRMELIAFRKTLDRRDLQPIARGLVHGHEARCSLPSSGDDETGAALAEAAAIPRTGETEVVAQRLQQRNVRLDIELAPLAVHGELVAHQASPCMRSLRRG